MSRTGILGISSRDHDSAVLLLDTKMTNGPVEGINNKLRVIARRAYGFHSHGALISMLFLCCGGIELAPPRTHTCLRRFKSRAWRRAQARSVGSAEW